METFTGDFLTWSTGRLKDSRTPQEQMNRILKKWNGGEVMVFDRMMKDLIPRRDEIWEMKTTDLRLFGWIYRPRVFIAALLEYADWYKSPTKRFTYEDARKRVISVRDKLDLDPPKFTPGEFYALV